MGQLDTAAILRLTREKITWAEASLIIVILFYIIYILYYFPLFSMLV